MTAVVDLFKEDKTIAVFIFLNCCEEHKFA